ncbi:hypothetical protein F5B22DRAFT_458394 [Xylaria bambusicola]|uniref:uncharacterized protein n=1 Tax=Xylaria bambusicola TaxID=326684 RepID=UPI0020078BB6|nr:uncharacterized protein F5B22DRAFT_458394 [Xylaria bambusicola]KAI0522092.1 hypothetical protein F5B22DRAFT_458394 [Xylaria bambusicola]
MDAASTAINKMFHRGSNEDELASGKAAGAGLGKTDSASIDRTTADAVEHEKIHKKHQEREQKIVDKERHQDHYKTTVQPLKERQVMPEEHQHTQADTQRHYVDHRDSERDAKTMLERKQKQFTNTSEEFGTQHQTVQEPTVTREHVHHHLHETVQPIIERETVMPSVTHKTIPIKEVHQEPSIDEGITRNAAMTKEEFENRTR